MTENINLDSTNLSIPEDAFDQFQRNSMYEEEEYITLSDIVSPEPTVPHLPSDLSDIPYDNEVVLSGNDYPLLDDSAGIASTQPTDFTYESTFDNNAPAEQVAESISEAEQTPDQSYGGRPRRDRKKKSYVDDLYVSTDLGVEANAGSRRKTASRTPKGRKRGGKPKQTVDQNEIATPENLSQVDPVKKTPKTKKVSRKKLSQVTDDTNNLVEDPADNQNALCENLSESLANDSLEIANSTKSPTRKQGVRRKKNPVLTPNSGSEIVNASKVKVISGKRGKPNKRLQEIELLDSNTSELQADSENTLTRDLKNENDLKGNVSKKKSGRRGKSKDLPPEDYLLESHESLISDADVTQEFDGSEGKDISSDTTQKKKTRRPRKDKMFEENTAEASNDKKESDDDELDNLSLKTLSMRNGDISVTAPNIDPTETLSTKFETQTESEEINIGENMALGQLKDTLHTSNTEVLDMELDETVESHNSDLNTETVDVKSELLENGDKHNESEIPNDTLLMEDDSKRPMRRRTRKVMHYDEGSDEDPFANIEISDDEPSGKKGRYYSDDEYIPGSENKKGSRGRKSITSDDDSDISDMDEILDDYPKNKRKRLFSSSKSSRGNKGKKSESDKKDINVTTIAPKATDDVDDIEVCLQSSVIQTNENNLKNSTSVYTNEFENFIAQKIHGTNIQIKKVSSEQTLQNTPLEIPVLNPDAKKTIEVSVQTNTVKTTSSGVQTNVQHEIPMKDNVTLTNEQAEKACEFLKSIVKTTSELGQLMTEKSEDFITKKINTNHVTDTFKMDYCVKKSFLLLKLAKHNIVQMEEDLAKQYEEFLKQTNLISHRQKEKVIKPTVKDSDSDCEIVEEPQSTTSVKPNKAKFNPKTVFLNKELSIKIAKKPASKSVADKCKNTLNIKNKNSVWISDSVMVKKVKPTQSFLAQDSRNKKPPDNLVTEKMVSDFFDTYYKKMAPLICAPFTYTEWHCMPRTYVCNYFFVKSDQISAASTSFPIGGEIHVVSNNNDTTTENTTDNFKATSTCKTDPMSLINLCTEVLKKRMEFSYKTVTKSEQQMSSNQANIRPVNCPESLFRLCLNVISETNIDCDDNLNQTPQLEPMKPLVIEKVDGLPDFKIESAMETKSFDSHNVDIERLNLCVKEPGVLSDTDAAQPISESAGLSCDNFKIVPCLSERSIEPHYSKLKANKKHSIPTLKTMCFRKIRGIFLNSYEGENSMENDDNVSEDSFLITETGSYDLSVSEIDDMIAELDSVLKNDVKSLFSLCFEFLQKQHMTDVKKVLDIQEKVVSDQPSLDELNDITTIVHQTPNSLKLLTFEIVKNMMYTDEKCSKFDRNKDDTIEKLRVNSPVYKVKSLADLCFQVILSYTSDTYNQAEKTPELTINCVNTLSEEAFHNIERENIEEDDDGNYFDEDNYNDSFNNFEDEQGEINNWESQVQVQEFKPCITTNKQNDSRQFNEEENLADEDSNLPAQESIISQVKLEPLDEPSEVDSTIIKTELMQNDEMTIIPESIKEEQSGNMYDAGDKVPLQRQNSSSVDEHTFEDFVRRNKMMHALDDLDDEAYTQSGLRVRRQHKPDYMNEYDPSLNLLVPQTFEPLSIVNAKGVLMASSSDDENSGQKSNTKKKTDKKARGRPKKGEPKLPNKDAVSSKQNQDITNTKQGKEVTKQSKELHAAKGKNSIPPPSNEVAVLTRRMREKIRQEEKKIESSDSEGENIPIARKKEKDRKENENSKSVKNNKDEIQCSNVDSTEQIEQNEDSIEDGKRFTGFSSVDQNEISSYHKYVKFVYDKILPKVTESDENVTNKSANILEQQISGEIEDNDRSNTPVINFDEPTEMLECEPTMPIFDDVEEKKQRRNAKPKNKAAKSKEPENTKGNTITVPKEKESQTDKNEKKIYTEHCGWHCYPIDPNETKLYQNAAIILEKLPESFVDTYFEYQEITDKQSEDKEVDRLINLNTLNRSSMKESLKYKGKRKDTKDGQLSKSLDTSRAVTPTSDSCATLTASEDEGANVEDETPPERPLKNTNENHLAKNSLMNDSDSEEGSSRIKEELNADGQEGPKPASKKKSKGKTAPATVKSENPESLMLTADKMMNKELNLLHAPVVFGDANQIIEKGDDKGPSPKNKHRKRGSRGHSSRDNMRNEEDSSSEEEKQWVTTKEKLLKRMCKKQDTTSLDDAKRAKLVTEFIERREVAPGSHKRSGRGRGRRRNSRKVLEREKQMRVLSHELFGTPVDPALMGTRHQVSSSYFKGRRNIRKVIDKKSLARSTVIANMEEFERKCRLNQRQAQLRELLGCEEGVNVLVINDEVCLEYGFEDQCSLVSVHPFFTKVMKAHQYEGVKFMWDACFESLEKVESGHPGGGCILAHCMGLGKTLQVLALLHTVLTHPRVGMQRVLVCCPLSTVLNWVDEIHKWIGPVTDQIKVFELSKLKKTYERAYQLEDWYSGGGIFIIGYELFRSLTTLDPEFDDVRPTIINKIRTALLDPGPDIVVCDEGHLLKNDCSVLAVAMSRVATKRRIVLTGTPMQNNLREYYCMVNFVKPNLLGTYSEYSNRFENPIMNGQHRDSREEDIKLMKQRTHILHKVLEGCLQRQEASVLYPYLPKKHEYTVFISLTKVQWDLYKHYINNYSNTAKQSVLKDFHMLQKIWSHPLVLHNFQTKKRDELDSKIKPEKLEDDLAHEELTSEELKAAGAAGGGAAGAGGEGAPAEGGVWWLRYLDGGAMLDSLECSNKFLVIFKILDECIALGDKVLIFSTSLFTMDALEYFLKKMNNWSLGQQYYRLDGSVPAEVRQKWCREFNAEHNLNTKLFLISTRAGSLGLNMVAANRVILLDTSWNPAHDIQSIFRVYRFGQKKDCYIYRLVALGTMEQKIYERSVTKQAVSCRVVDEQQIDRHYNMAELTELYKYDEMGLSVSGGVAVGVTDVALLRVARHPALHAVHEHDSLLRGSSEQQLPEHERAAAWMQFQQEHAHKQMQNQLTSSFSLHLPSTQLPITQPQQTYQQLVEDNGLHSQIKTETPNLLVPYVPQTNKPGRKKKNKVTITIPRQPTPPPPAETDAVQEEMSRKITNILLHNNYQNKHGPADIAKLVATVRRIVATGYIPAGSFDNSIAQQIADVLLNKDPQPNSSQKKKGRPRKQNLKQYAITPTPSTSQPESKPDKDYSHLYPGRRRAAINAEKQLDYLKDSAMDQGGDDDDWHVSDEEEIVPETKPQKKSPRSTPVVAVKAETAPATGTEGDSIVLSDDDEPPPLVDIKAKKTKEPKKPEKIPEKVSTPALPAEEADVTPLHPSLLGNKNFIKIVAHTYLEGNPMLDEDAATLAAQYSTLKAKKEVEATGKPITNGPIYDIAVKVLGLDILKKLHKTNPNPEPKEAEPKTSESTTTQIVPKTEPAEAPRKTTGRKSIILTRRSAAEASKPVEASKPAEASKPVETSKPVEASKPETRKPGPRLKAKGLGELLAKSSPVTPPAPVPLTPTVVPVGFINRSGSVAPDGASLAPAQPLAPTTREESILPDDDDVTASPIPRNIFKKNAKPLILNSVLATTKPPPIAAPSQPKIPKLVISAGKLLPAAGFLAKATASPQTPSSDTICLDSDEETITSEPTPPPKRVALKSTARPHVAPAPAPAPASAPVPVSITAANPQLNVLLQQPQASPPIQQQIITEAQLNAMLNQQPIAGNTIALPPGACSLPGGKIIMLPKGQFESLARSHHLVPVNPANPIYQTQYVPQNVPKQPLLQVAPASVPTSAPAPNHPPIVTNTPENKPMQKTVCKPGDILRITKTGQIEVLNRDDDDVAIVDDAAPPSAPSKPPPSKEPPKRRGRPPAQRAPTPPPKPPSPPPKAPTPEKPTHERTRNVSISSSSSSDSSRASSPDPLSILKDVVHIKAPEDTPKPKPKPNKLTHVGNTSIKSVPSKSNSVLKSYHKEPPKILNKAPATQDDIMKHISKTDTILKRLDRALSSPAQKPKLTVLNKPAALAQKTKPATVNKTKSAPVKTIDLIDLDSYDQPSTTKQVAKPAPKAVTIKPVPAKLKALPTKIVGTSKDIIISVTGKSSSLTTTDSSRVTVEKVAPSTSGVKKRPAPSDGGPQKKKAAPMTLKDFNIDDIDDIIELE